MKTILTLLLSLFVSLAWADNREARNLTMADGLPDNYVSCIEQDSLGRLWIGTETGLAVFDGFTFRTFTGFDGLRGDAIRCLLADKGWMWIGTKSGICRMDIRSCRVDTFNIPYLYNVVDICRGANANELWFVNHYDCLVRYNTATAQRTVIRQGDIPGLNMAFRSITPAGGGLFYLGHAGGGLSLVDLSQRRLVRHFLHSENVYRTCTENDTLIWVGTNEGLIALNPKTGTVRHTDVTGHVFGLLKTKDGTIRHTEGNRVQIFEDRAGNLWECDYAGGLFFYSRLSSPFSVFPYAKLQDHKLVPQPVFGLYDDGTSLWMGGLGELLQVDSNGEITQTISTHSLPVQSILKAADGSMLVGLFDGGLLRLQHGKLQRVSGIDEVADVNSMLRDASAGIWICTEKGLYQYRDGVAKSFPPYAKQLKEMPLFSITFDKKGRMWTATYGDGIYRMQGGKFEAIKPNAETTFGCISHIICDSKGAIWAATRGGVIYFPNPDQPHQYKMFTTQNGLANNYIHALAEDSKGNIWMSTNVGISCWNRQRQQFFNYDQQLNVPRTNFNDASVVMVPVGGIAFGSHDGLCYFTPEARSAAQLKEQIQILDVQNDATDPSSLSITFGISDYALRGLVEYEYRIDGLGQSWHMVDPDLNHVDLVGLAPGNYTFHVRARLKNGEWSDQQMASVRFSIPYPWYQRWWAILIYVCLAVGAFCVWFYLYRRRVYTLGLLEVDRQRFDVYEKVTAEQRTQLEHFRSEVARLIEERSSSVIQKTQQEQVTPSQEKAFSEIDRQFMQRLDQLIQDNLDEERLDIAFFTDRLAMSTSTFYRKMKSVTGVSANEYVRKKRLEASLKLLNSGKYNINEVAERTGFSSSAYFRELFKAEYGCTPSEYVAKKKE